MCGISGIHSYPGNPFLTKERLGCMANAIRHRGPDATGLEVFCELGLGMAHNRLKIIDLSEEANQPMRDSSGRYLLAFNGEIYNYLELKAELEEQGVSFRTSSDTEVLLELLALHGMNTLNRLRGMWAFSFYDTKTGLLYLGRDKLGKKPMYWGRYQDSVLFGSEPKALLAAGMPKKVNFRKLSRYIAWNYRFGEWNQDSFFADIEAIPAGTVIRFDQKGQSQTVWEWAPVFHQTIVSEAEALDVLRDRFTESVKLRMRADVPVGAMVSGGLDSTSVVATCYKALGNQVRLFSGITGSTRGIYDESPWVNELVRHLGAPAANFIDLDLSEFEKNCRDMIRIFDEPVITVSFLPLFLLYKNIREQGIRVVLTGHGGDEVFAGYWHHFLIHFGLFEGQERQKQILAWRKVHQRSYQEISKSRYRDFKAISPENFSDYSDLLGAGREVTLSDLLQSRRTDLNLDPLNFRLCQELMYDHVPPVLKAEDRVSMGNGIESRCPMLDLELITTALLIPGRLKIDQGLNKVLLRKAMTDFLPQSIVKRPDKVGLNCPFDLWMRSHLRDFVKRMTIDGVLVKSGYLNSEGVTKLFMEQQSGASHGQFFWQLVQAELWIQEYGLESQF